MSLTKLFLIVLLCFSTNLELNAAPASKLPLSEILFRYAESHGMNFVVSKPAGEILKQHVKWHENGGALNKQALLQLFEDNDLLPLVRQDAIHIYTLIETQGQGKGFGQLWK